LSDFGFSKQISKIEFLTDIVGTEGSMAPEMLSGLPYDGIKADYFACGVLLFGMLFREYPFCDYSNLDEATLAFLYERKDDQD